ncbi:MAG: CheR family methyltransferase [Gammaproteobacteria bacterium]
MSLPLEWGEIENFRDIVSERLGLAFDDSKLGDLANVLHERMRATGCDRASVYINRLVSSASSRPELRGLAERFTVGETYFFRHRDQFRALVESALPERIRAEVSGRRLRLLSAGCASGEEPYTLAILLGEYFPHLGSWEILGLDVNASSLTKARQARYSEWSLRETPEPIRQRYFRREGKEFALDERIRTMVSFEERNLLDEDSSFWRPGAFDIIFCRNVTMYFTPEAVREVVTRLVRALASGGFLFLGSSETLRGVSQAFHLRHTHGSFYFQLRPREELGAVPTIPGHVPLVCSETSPLLPVPSSDISWLDSIFKASERIAALASVAPRGMARSATSAAQSRPSWDLSYATELLRQERFQEAMGVLRSLPPEADTDADAQLLLAVVLAQKGEVAEAERVRDKILALDEINAGAHYLVALCREHSGDRAGAREHDQIATYLDPAFARPHLHLGLLARGRGQLEAARREFSQTLVLLAREDASRVLLFGGGFNREALMRFCRAELQAAGGSS